MNMQEFLTAHPVTLEVLTHKLDKDGEGWEHNAYNVKLTHKGRSIEQAYKMGVGLTGHPQAGDVLESLALDSRIGNAGSFEGFCAELGYDTDSRKAEASYRECQAITSKLIAWLGADVYAQLMEVEDA